MTLRETKQNMRHSAAQENEMIYPYDATLCSTSHEKRIKVKIGQRRVTLSEDNVVLRCWCVVRQGHVTLFESRCEQRRDTLSYVI